MVQIRRPHSKRSPGKYGEEPEHERLSVILRFGFGRELPEQLISVLFAGGIGDEDLPSV